MDVFGGFGGQAAANNMDVSVGDFDGKWLLFSLEGDVIPAGYYHLTTLNIQSLEEVGCDPNSFGVQGFVASTINVSAEERVERD